jgi:hypothetical protein
MEIYGEPPRGSNAFSKAREVVLLSIGRFKDPEFRISTETTLTSGEEKFRQAALTYPEVLDRELRAWGIDPLLLNGSRFTVLGPMNFSPALVDLRLRSIEREIGDLGSNIRIQNKPTQPNPASIPFDNMGILDKRISKMESSIQLISDQIVLMLSKQDSMMIQLSNLGKRLSSSSTKSSGGNPSNNPFTRIARSMGYSKKTIRDQEEEQSKKDQTFESPNPVYDPFRDHEEEA